MPAHARLSDDELLAAYRRTGDRDWLGQLLERHTVLLLGVAVKYLKDREAAADAVQQVFLKAITHLPQGEIKNFKGWLYVLVRNQCMQHLRDQAFHAPEETLESVPATETTSADEHWQAEMTLEQLREALQQISPEQRLAIDLFYLQQQSYAQVQEQTGFTFAQVKSYIQNGKRALRLLLQKTPARS